MSKQQYKHFTSFIILISCMVLVVSGCGKSDSGSTQTNVQEKTETVIPKEIPVPSSAPITEERTFYDFDYPDLNGWEVPLWAKGKADYVAKNAEQSTDFATSGEYSMKIDTEFNTGLWAAALVEIEQYLNLSAYRVISADVYLPEGAPEGLKAKMCITIGENWRFIEMSRSVPLIPGQWITITASIEPGSYDWKRIVPDETFAEDVRKISVRVEVNRKPQYTGPIYIDNVRAGR